MLRQRGSVEHKQENHLLLPCHLSRLKHKVWIHGRIMKQQAPGHRCVKGTLLVLLKTKAPIIKGHQTTTDHHVWLFCALQMISIIFCHILAHFSLLILAICGLGFFVFLYCDLAALQPFYQFWLRHRTVLERNEGISLVKV